MEESAAKTYGEMQQQMQAVEADLETSRVLREKQSKEMKRQIEEEKRMAQKEVRLTGHLTACAKLLGKNTSIRMYITSSNELSSKVPVAQVLKQI